MKVIHKAFRYKLKPTEQQTTLLYRMVGCGRFVYNASQDLLLDVACKELGGNLLDGHRCFWFVAVAECAEHRPASGGDNSGGRLVAVRG